MKKNIFILLLITTILCLSSCSGFLNDLVGFTEGSTNTSGSGGSSGSGSGGSGSSNVITVEVINFTTTDSEVYHIITWSITDNSSIDHYELLGVYSTSIPSQLNQVLVDDIDESDSSFFDTTNIDKAYQTLYYQIKGYDSNDNLIATSNIATGTKDFLDTILYYYDSSDSYSHQFVFQGADNCSFYRTLIMKTGMFYGDGSSTWILGNTQHTIPSVKWNLSGDTTRYVGIKVEFNIGTKILYSEPAFFERGDYYYYY